jgi:porin
LLGCTVKTEVKDHYDFDADNSHSRTNSASIQIHKMWSERVMDELWLTRRKRLPFSGFLFVYSFVCAACVGYSDDEQQESVYEEDRSGFVSIEPIYYGEVFTNARGGKSTKNATQYQGLLDLGITFDFEKSGSSLPGSLFLLAQNTHGRGLTQDFIGDTQVISNIDSFDNIMQVGEYWWESRWLDDDITVRLGKQDLNHEFQRIGEAEFFIQSTFGLSPSTAFPTYPDQALGAVALLQLHDALQLKVGAWSAFARGGSWGYSESDSYLVVSELERRYSLLQGRLPGIVAVGALYESEGEIDAQPVSAVREYYFQWEQSVYRESPRDAEANQGMAMFAGYYPRFPGEQIILESIGDSAVAGVTYTGLLQGRDDDLLGVGVAWAELYQGGTNQEMVTELFYRANWTTRLSVQPDLQYISSPSGIFRDALAVGVRFEFRP